MTYPTEKHLKEFNKDKFGYQTLSSKILDEILLKMELPNCFGLYGNWGSGKSTILNYIKQHIENQRKDEYKDIITVYFEPWKYEYSDKKDLIFALLNCIKKQTGTDKKLWKSLMVDIAVIFTGVLRSAQLVDVESTVKDLERFESEIYNEHDLWVDKIEKFQDGFKTVINKILENKNASKLIIFIDDLDRCLPENTVKFLEGIKNFLFVEKTLFVLAVDRGVVSEMIEKKYGLSGYGEEYLMKIIHYYYELPIIDLSDVVDEVFSLHKIEALVKQKSYIVGFLKDEAKDPRVAKHILNQFCMALSISKKSKQLIADDKTEQQLQYFFIGSFILTRFPRLFSSDDSTELLKNIYMGANTIEGGYTGGDEYKKILEAFVINPSIRKKLESIFRHAINSGKESSPLKLINYEGVSIAIKQIRTI